MKLTYYPETDSLYFDLSDRPSFESKEVAQGVVLDFDDKGNLTGIDIDQASTVLDLKKLILNKVPIVEQSITA